VFVGTFFASGKVRKFVPKLQQLTFNARSSRNRVESITYITERAVFVRRDSGLVLTEIAPGIDVQRDILEEIPFPVAVDGALKLMDAALFSPPSGHVY
jgi:propionate CoA-transferase